MMELFTPNGTMKDLYTIYREHIAAFEKYQYKNWGQSATSILIGTPRQIPKDEEPKKLVKKNTLPKKFLPKPAYKGAR
jgi:hypothetical protein